MTFFTSQRGENTHGRLGTETEKWFTIADFIIVGPVAE
jgi:hypothetical protein